MPAAKGCPSFRGRRAKQARILVSPPSCGCTKLLISSDCLRSHVPAPFVLPICSPQSVIAKHPAHDHLLKVQYLLGSFGNLACCTFGSSGYPVLSSGAMRLVLRHRITSRLRSGRKTAYGADSRAIKNQLSLNFLHRLPLSTIVSAAWDFPVGLLY